MTVYKIDKEILQKGYLELNELHLNIGDKVEVTISKKKKAKDIDKLIFNDHIWNLVIFTTLMEFIFQYFTDTDDAVYRIVNLVGYPRCELANRGKMTRPHRFGFQFFFLGNVSHQYDALRFTIHI